MTSKRALLCGLAPALALLAAACGSKATPGAASTGAGGAGGTAAAAAGDTSGSAKAPSEDMREKSAKAGAQAARGIQRNKTPTPGKVKEEF